MMINKKAQGEVITTVLIILLVLAAIVIVWQVVNSTISKGAKQVESQTACIGFGFEPITASSSVTDGPLDTFIIKRTTQGGTFKTTELRVLINGDKHTLTDGTYKLVNADGSPFTGSLLLSPLDTVKIVTTLKNADDTEKEPTSIEISLVGDGATCPATIVWTKP
jgi:hypothetical protein